MKELNGRSKQRDEHRFQAQNASHNDEYSSWLCSLQISVMSLQISVWVSSKRSKLFVVSQSSQIDDELVCNIESLTIALKFPALIGRELLFIRGQIMI